MPSSLRRGIESPWLAPVLSAVLALLVRVAYVFDIKSSVLFDSPIMDAAVHDGWARGTLDFLYAGIAYFRAPLYPWFLQGVYALWDDYLAPRLVQALLSACSVGLVADMARRVAGPMAGLCAGFLLAFCWPAIYFSGELLIETLFVVLLIAGLWSWQLAGSSARVGWALLGAALFGVASMVRPTALVCLPLALWLGLRVWPRHGFVAARRAVPAMLLLMLLPGLGLSVRNKVVGDDWVFIASQGGVNLFIGNNVDSDGRTAVVPGTSATWLGGYEDTNRRARQAMGRPLKPSEVSAYYTRQAGRYWIEEPADALGLYLRKLRLLFGAAERGNNQNLHFWRAQSDLLRLPVFTSWASLFALGLVGLWLFRTRLELAALSGYLLLYALGLIPFFINERFRFPITVALAVPAGLALAQIVTALRDGRRRSALTASALAVLLFALVSLDRIGFKEDRIEADAFSRYTVGNAYLRKRQPREALDWFNEAQLVAQQYRLRNFEEAGLQLQKGRVRAFAQLHDPAAMDLELKLLESAAPQDPEVLTLRGDQHRMQWNFAQAYPCYERALAIDPRHGEALLGLAWCQVHQRELYAARVNFQKVLRSEPRSASALAGLGNVDLWESANVESARPRLLLAFAIDPDEAAAHRMLAEIYRRDQRTPEAVWHYREAIRLDPFDEGSRRYLNRAGIPHEHDEFDRKPGT